jgi:hypothetical protein
MMQCHPDCLALVLKNEDVLYERMFLEFFEAVPPNPHQLVDLLDRFGRERGVVIW